MKKRFSFLMIVAFFLILLTASCGEGILFPKMNSGNELDLDNEAEGAVNAMRTADAAMVDEQEYETSQQIDISFDQLEDVRDIYRPISDCAPSRLRIGDTIYVSYGGTPNGIRSEPDVHPDNIFYRAVQGEQLRIIGGPACSWGWILWEVRTIHGQVGWTPESDGDEFWLVPIIDPRDLPSKVESDPELYKVYEEVESVMSSKSLSNSEKQERLRTTQDKYGEEVVAYIIRYVPVYNTDSGQFESFDSVMRGFASDYGYSSSNAPIETDPVGAGIKIFFDPSPETITEMLGLYD